MIRDEIKKIVAKTAGIDELLVVLEYPDDEKFGDYSTNIAMRLAGERKESPKKIAENLIARIGNSTEAKKIFKKIELAGPGFINFFLTDEFLVEQVDKLLIAGDDFGRLQTTNKKSKTALIEFLSANPTGKLHLGHGRNAFFGDALANVLNVAGYKVTREYYQNDAKASTQIRNLGKTAIGEGTTYLTEGLRLKIKNQKYNAAI